jgi:LPS-assembly lipoprotein
MTTRRTMLLILAASLLGACSFKPLYGGGENSVAAQGLAQVSIEEQKTRAGQLLRNELLAGRNVPDSAPYRLGLDVTETGKAEAGSSARVQYRMSVVYRVTDTATGKVVDEGKSYSVVAFDTVNEPLSDLQAENAARQRAARELGQDIKLRLAARFAG